VNRRGFLQSLGVAVVGYALSGQLSGIVPKTPRLRRPKPTLVTDGWTADTKHLLKKGDIFTIDGQYVVNPSGAHGSLRQFVVMDVIDGR
jgi:hypothetical protein